MFRFLLFFTFLVTLHAQESSLSISLYEDADSVLERDGAYMMRQTFEPYDGKKKNFGFSSSTIWVYIQLVNHTPAQQEKAIVLPYPHLDFVHVYNYQNQRLKDSYLTGDRASYTSRKTDSEKFILPVVLKEGESKEVLLQIYTEGALNIGIKVLDMHAFYEQEHTNAMIFGGYYSAVLLMLLYNSILFLIIKDRVYGDYIFFHFVYLLLQLGLNGHAFAYFWKETPEVNIYFIPLAMVLSHYAAINFTNSFLEVKKRSYRLYKYLELLKYSQLFLLVYIFVLPYNTNIKLLTAVGAVVVVSLFAIGVYHLVRDKSSASKFFVAAWGFLLIGALIAVLQNFGVLNMSYLTLYGPQIGAFFELALFSFALAYRYNNVHYHALLLNRSELYKLKNKIQQRTIEVALKNGHPSQEVQNK